MIVACRAEVPGSNQWDNAMAPHRGDPKNPIRYFPVSHRDSVRQIVVVWNKGQPPELSEFDSAVPVRIRVEERNSLTNRFKVDSSIKTRAVLELDDDIMIPCDDIERGFKTTDNFEEVKPHWAFKESMKGRNAWNGARSHHLDVQQLSSGEWVNWMGIKKMTTESQMQDDATIMAVTSIAMTSYANTLQHMAPAEKPEKKMTTESQMHDDATTVATTSIATTSSANAPQHMAPVEKPEKNYILSGLQEDLYNIYSETKTSKELWGALEQKYKIENAGINKFVVARFLDFKMIDSKSVVSQVQELQVIIHDLLVEGISLKNTLVEQLEKVLNTHINCFVSLIANDAFQVAALIEKLPSIWKDFKNYLKHKCREMTVEDLIVRLHIEKDNKTVERRSKGNSAINGAHIVEDEHNNSKKKEES
ncbi:hypothetical protein T459_16271 [Capsicum annuum]|uniref:Glycosyl transferase 64 domain-containing protein n=1 Tax=Capsicum annuum TaxID=4072 RepID=A0A2G2Z8C3_CAPAN|nr:hypothetical protein T459_16271 [Capsicum annuum]